MARPPVTYPVNLADLITIADAARELDAMRAHYVDQPDEQQHIGRRAKQLNDIVARAALGDAVLIYGDTQDAQHGTN